MAKNKRKFILSAIVIIAIAGLGIFLYIKSIISTGFNIDKTVYVFVDERKNYDDLLHQLDTTAHVSSMENFKRVASFMDLSENLKTGRYAIKPEMNIREAINTLKSGIQTPVKLTFNNIRLKNDLAKRLSAQLMMKETDLQNTLNDQSVATKYGFTPETFVAMFIPNTYEIYWDIKPDALFDRMDKEYKKFWTPDRLQKAENLNLTPIEVTILASIVEEECFFADEYPVVAGLYLNRLKRGQRLQADPTVKFAVGDFSLKRILNKHLEIDSPYNTYQNVGLPPGPIRLPSIKGIDAVLNPAKHDYLYMCAKEDFSGRHNFAVTHAEHERNANRYRAALNQRKIYR